MANGVIKRLWNSPTFTNWFYQGAMALQLLAVAPILLKKFTSVEIAAWYLFGSLNIVGTIVIARVSLTFARMIALEVGRWKKETNVSSDQEAISSSALWLKIQPIIETMGAFQIRLVLGNVLLATLLASLSLVPIAKGVVNADKIWLAFFIYQIGSVANFYVSRYHVILMGFNAVAISNRLSGIVMIVGLSGVAVVIYYGYGIIIAALIAQMIALVGGLLAARKLKAMANGAAGDLERVKSHSAIAQVAYQPIGASLLAQLASSGLLPISSVLVARNFSVEVAAGFAFYVRLLTAAEQVGMAPFNSVQPAISQLLAMQHKATAKRKLLGRGAVSLMLFCLVTIILCNSLPYLKTVLKARIEVLSAEVWLVLLLGLMLNRANGMLLAPYYATNRIKLWRESCAATILAMVAMYFTLPYVGLMAIGLSITLSTLIVFWNKPVKLYREEFKFC